MNDRIERIHQAIDEKKYDEALRIIEIAVDDDPANMTYHWLKARILGLTGQITDAVTLYNSIIRFLAKGSDAYRWQEIGFVRYEIALLLREENPAEARHEILLATQQIGIYAETTAWQKAAEWAWEDGDYEQAGKLWHDLLKMTDFEKSLPEHVLMKISALPEEHPHTWIYLAKMRAMFEMKYQPDQIEALIPKTANHPMAYRIAGEAYRCIGNNEQSFLFSEQYLRECYDPISMVALCEDRFLLGQPDGLEALTWQDDANMQGRDYYSAACCIDELIVKLKAKGYYHGADDMNIIKKIQEEAYRLGAKRFEAFLETGQGDIGSADPHIYSMLCNNLGICLSDQERYEEAIEYHEKGINTSPFWEHWDNMLDNLVMTQNWRKVMDCCIELKNEYSAYNKATLYYYLSEIMARIALNDYNQTTIAGLYEQAYEWHEKTERPYRQTDLDLLAFLDVTVAAYAASHQQLDLLQKCTDRLFANTHISQTLCDKIADAWESIGNTEKASYYRKALKEPELQIPAIFADGAITLEAMEIIYRSAALETGILNLNEDNWKFQVDTDLDVNGNKVPVLIQAWRDAEAWQLIWWQKTGLFHKLKGNNSIQFLYSPQGLGESIKWTEVKEPSVQMIWDIFKPLFSRAEYAWSRLRKSVTRESLGAFLEMSMQYQQELNPEYYWDLDNCSINVRTADSGEYSRLMIKVNQHFHKRNLRIEEEICDMCFRGYYLPADPEKKTYFSYQEGNNQQATQLYPDDVEKVLDTYRWFNRAKEQFTISKDNEWLTSQLLPEKDDE